MELSEQQDALLELRDKQLTLEAYRDEKYPNDGIVEEIERPRAVECLRVLGLTEQAASDPLGWLITVDGVRTLQRLAGKLLPLKLVTLTDNDRALLKLMLSEGATSPASCKPAELLMAAIGGGDYKKAFKRLKAGGYALSGTGRGSGWYLTRLGRHEAKRVASQNGTLSRVD